MPLDPSGAIAVQAFYGIRSERQLMEQLDYNRLYCWFVGLSPIRSGTRPASRRTVSGCCDCQTSIFGGRDLIEAWASQKSFRLKDGSDDGDRANFHGQKRKSDTHASTSDPDVAFAKPAGREAKLSHMGHAQRHPERRASEGMLKIQAKVTASLPVTTNPMIRPIMWPIFAPSTSRRT
jgi:hypothetical protein